MFIFENLRLCFSAVLQGIFRSVRPDQTGISLSFVLVSLRIEKGSIARSNDRNRIGSIENFFAHRLFAGKAKTTTQKNTDGTPSVSGEYMREFTRIMLAAYPRIPHLIGTMNEVISQTALRSFYDRSDPVDAAARLLKKIEKRDALAFLGDLMRRGVESLPKEQKQILSERYFGEGKTYRRENYVFSKSTYYRRLRRAVKGLETYFAKEGAEERFYRCGLHKTAFFAFLADHLAMRRRKKQEEKTAPVAVKTLPVAEKTASAEDRASFTGVSPAPHDSSSAPSDRSQITPSDRSQITPSDRRDLLPTPPDSSSAPSDRSRVTNSTPRSRLHKANEKERFILLRPQKIGDGAFSDGTSYIQ